MYGLYMKSRVYMCLHKGVECLVCVSYHGAFDSSFNGIYDIGFGAFAGFRD